MSSLNHSLAAECRARNIEVDVSDIEALSSWQRNRLQQYLKTGSRTLPRLLNTQAETPDFRVPWIEDIVHDVEDCLKFQGVELSRSLATKIRQRSPIAMDLWVTGFWSVVNEGREPSALDIDSIPLRGECDGDQKANPLDLLALTEVSIPESLGDVVEIFEGIERLNANIEKFLTGLAAISMQPDYRPIADVLNDDELIAKLRKLGVGRVCDLVASVVTGSIHQYGTLSKKNREAVVLTAAEIQRQCVDSIRNAIAKKS